MGARIQPRCARVVEVVVVVVEVVVVITSTFEEHQPNELKSAYASIAGLQTCACFAVAGGRAVAVEAGTSQG